jgi:hypothetical protein
MAIEVILRGEFGNDKGYAVYDDHHLFSSFIISLGDDSRFQWANTIDPYGKAIFNKRQAQYLRKEWEQLIEIAPDEETREHLKRIDNILSKCASGRRLYVHFIGD